MARKKLVAGNWKMYTTPDEAGELAGAVARFVQQHTNPEVVICPPFTSIAAAKAAIVGTAVRLGGQDMYFKPEGAYTGEVSGRMLLTAGCSYVILGHSERRQLFFETDLTVNAKLKTAITVGLKPIVCVGETLEQREAGITERVVEEQLLGCFTDIPVDAMRTLAIAYEPVWAIGTGRTATPEQAEEVHRFVRGIVRRLYGDVADEVVIVYGGSIKPDNAADLFGEPDIDGGLVGGASLNADSFIRIIAAARR